MSSVSATSTSPVPVAPQSPSRRPGFDAAGKPLPDDRVWDHTAAPGRWDVNTGNGITVLEAEKLANFAQKNPAEFVQRLYADSANGTPVAFKKTFRTDYGMLNVDVTVVDGKLDAKAELEVFKKAVRRSGLTDVMTNPNMPGGRPVFSIHTRGDIQPDGAIQDIQASLQLDNIPQFSARKIAGEKGAIKDLRAALRQNSRAKRLDGALSVIQDIYARPEVFIPMLLAEVADDSSGVDVTIQPHDYAARLAATLGGGSFDVSVDHLLSGKTHDPDDLNVKATLRGKVVDTDGIKVDNLALATTQKISATFGADGDPVVTVDGTPMSSGEARDFAMFAAFAVMSLAGGGF